MTDRRGALLAGCAVLCLAGCAPRSPGPSPAARAADTVRVLAYNIHHGAGMDDVVNLERIAAVIRDLDPDVVALQEVDSVTSRTNRVDQAAELGRLTGLRPVFGRFMDYQGGAYGMALLTAWPILESDNLVLPDGEEPRTALSVVIRAPTSGRRLRFVGIHLYRTESERLAQASLLERHLRDEALPTILAGDFNSWPESAVMTRLEQDWSIVPKDEDRFTFPSFAPDEEIDFILLRPAGAFDVLEQWLLDEPIASDHRPLVADVVLRPR